MSLRATKSSWKIRNPPCKREPLGYEHVFNEADAERLQHGLIPQGMEDKWFAYFEDGWLHLHRSWTGSLIYWIKLSSCPGGMHVTESWVNRDPDQYQEDDNAVDRSRLNVVLQRLLLGQAVDSQS